MLNALNVTGIRELNITNLFAVGQRQGFRYEVDVSVKEKKNIP